MVSITIGACTSTGKRDQNYGTDAGTVYEPVEAGVRPDVVRSERAEAGTQDDGSADGAGDATIDAETDATHDDR
jgi:hypothetical protein